MAKPPRRRADELLAERGFAPDPKAAAALILAARVLVTDDKGRERKVLKAGEPLEPGVRFRLKGDKGQFASRAGHKLAGALDHFGVDPAGRVALDLGLSTGGFTDCLLQRGALRVHGVDVAYGIVDWRLRMDARLVLHERTNVRNLSLEQLGERASLVVIDLSFIGLELVWPVLPPLLDPGAEGVALVKPQFELPRGATEGGIVGREEDRAAALARARAGAEAAGLTALDAVDSSVAGRDGNRELLLHFRR